MEPLKGMPLVGQGKPLPPDFPYKGEWIHEGALFLYRPTHQTSLGGQALELAPYANHEGRVCAGFNSMQIAWALGVGSEQIFEHNRAGTLYLVRTDEIPPQHGGLAAKQYVFQIGDKQAPFVIEAGGPTGHA